MAIIYLKDADDNPVEIEQDEGSKLTGITLYDEEDPENAIIKSALTALTMTVSTVTGTVINSQADTDILDANGGTVATGGAVEIKLAGADNPIVDTNVAIGEVEEHAILLKFTYNDADADSRHGRQEYRYSVRKVPVA